MDNREVTLPNLSMLKTNKESYCYIFKTINRNGKLDWSYAGIDLNYQSPSYRKPSVDMGEVKVEDYEVAANNYNL